MTSSISDNSILNALFIIAPQFYTTDQSIIAGYEALINLVQCQLNAQVLACCGPMVAAFLVAHYLTLSTNPNLGVNSNMTEGQLSIGFNVNPEISALNLTPYGRSYLDLVNRTVVGAFTTNLPPSLGGINNGFPAVSTGCCGGFGSWAFPVL